MTTQNSERKYRISRILLTATTCGLLAVLLTQPAKAQTINPGIIDPTNTYAGKTYSEWSAAWWQHFMSLSATNTPYHRSAPYLDAPLSTGQSGPVWFMLGNFLPGGTYTYTNTIPGGVGLFVPLTENWGDNTGCPSPTAYSTSQLRAMAKSGEDGASGMSCMIDGVAISGLTNVLTTPYRVQSIVFSYTCPAVHNILSDVFGETCYSNNAGTPYTINGVIEDGVFLMVAPLSAGKHVVHGTWAFPPSLSESWTRNLTVLPVALTVNASAQPGNLILSWPQTPDNYTVQTSPSLSPPDWQPANLVVTTNNGILHATAPVGTTNQFFRIQLN